MTLEKTILNVANQKLLELESYAKDTTPSEDILGRLSELTGLTELARVAESGLSKGAIMELINIEKKALSLIYGNNKDITKKPTTTTNIALH